MLAIAGDPLAALMEPKLMFGLLLLVTGPPLGMYPLVPAALIVTTDGFLPCSVCEGPPFIIELLLTIAGAPTAGTAGGIMFLPFAAGETELDLACRDCRRVSPCDWGVLEAMGAVAKALFVAAVA